MEVDEFAEASDHAIKAITGWRGKAPILWPNCGTGLINDSQRCKPLRQRLEFMPSLRLPLRL